MNEVEQKELTGRLQSAEKSVALMTEIDYVIGVLRSGKYDDLPVEKIAIGLDDQNRVEDEILVSRPKTASASGDGGSTIGIGSESDKAEGIKGLISPLMYPGIGEELRAAMIGVFERRRNRLAAEYAGI
jgi:hypothetical protein